MGQKLVEVNIAKARKREESLQFNTKTHASIWQTKEKKKKQFPAAHQRKRLRMGESGLMVGGELRRVKPVLTHVR